MKRYKITNITDLQGNPRTDGRYPTRIGRTVCFPQGLQEGQCAIIEYRTDQLGIPCPRQFLSTSVVNEIRDDLTVLEVKTKNSIYVFSEV